MSGSRITCPGCNGRGFRFDEHGGYDCPLRCERGTHSLPLRYRVVLLDVVRWGDLREFYNVENVPDLGAVEEERHVGY